MHLIHTIHTYTYMYKMWRYEIFKHGERLERGPDQRLREGYTPFETHLKTASCKCVQKIHTSSYIIYYMYIMTRKKNVQAYSNTNDASRGAQK